MANIYQDLDRLAADKSAGKLLDPIDEQRLRDHQLRRLRKLWLKDQVLTAREPLQPPKQPSFAEKISNKLFGDLKTRTLASFVASKNKSYGKFALYKAVRSMKVIGLFMAVGVPFTYYGNYKAAVPPDYAVGDDIIYPGDDYVVGKRSDFKWDPYTASYKLKPASE